MPSEAKREPQGTASRCGNPIFVLAVLTTTGFGDKPHRSDGNPATGKTVVAGAVRRSGNDGESSRVIASVLPDRRRETVKGYVRETVAPDTTLYTDRLPAYVALGDEYVHAPSTTVVTRC